MAVTRTGGCLCGAVRYESEGAPVFSLQCHCRDCQRSSGTAYIAAIRVPSAGFRITQGAPKRYVGKADSGNEIIRAFCGDCGSSLFGLPGAAPEIVMIRAGSLDEPSSFKPSQDIFTASAQRWDYMNPELPKVSRLPDPPAS